MTMHLRDLRSQLIAKLTYVQSVLTAPAGLATWEKREYEELRDNYTAAIDRTNRRIKAMNELYGVSGW